MAEPAFPLTRQGAADRAEDALHETLSAFELGIATDKDVREAWALFRLTRPPGTRWAIRG